ncbi:MAG TPA: hypothetical protein VKE74_11085 [Gemmataceae bacterium]|nr:hypothetical protein [Gemmataceae bacterium]
MASDKKRRKQAKQKRPPRPTGQPFVHPDGDRRRREAASGGGSVKQAIRDKKLRQTFVGGLGGEEE